MTKGTTRRERKYRKKAVSVCKITSTSNQNANNNNNTNPTGNNHERGLLIPNTLTSPITIGTPSSQISNNNNNSFSSPQLQLNKVIICTFILVMILFRKIVLDNFRFNTYSNNSCGIYCNTFSSIST
jgi:hypothetical protein